MELAKRVLGGFKIIAQHFAKRMGGTAYSGLGLVLVPWPEDLIPRPIYDSTLRVP